MLHRLVYADWEDPPEAMAFEVSYRDALAAIKTRLGIVQEGLTRALTGPAGVSSSYWDACLELYLLTPAIVNVALNYKVCLEHGLPLHPTHYFEVNDQTRGQVVHPEPLVDAGQAFFEDAIAAALAVFRLDPAAGERLAALAAEVPAGVGTFVYTSTRDTYTWRASEPAKIADLAAAIRASISPAIVVGAAHGSITAALVLATMLETPLYFIRFSMFKRNDTEPVIGPRDLVHLARYRRGPALLFDEDVAKGVTLTAFTARLAPLFEVSYSAGVLRNAFAGFRPDFVGRVWYD
ncbi:MAG TPA: hypothetical protein P5234_15525 [Thermoanaerobaculaceae bacterium]|nr:hypothetical protein [Thermoanaerobaculaceae bacterium]HRS17646.1 hypothetical protein [Thermoanaerobaculaceae bacterium]